MRCITPATFGSDPSTAPLWRLLDRRLRLWPDASGSLDLAALLCSRVCHDLISPVGAIVNGLEVLEEDKERGDQGRLRSISSRKARKQASARLQFCRIAFGAAGSAGAQIDIGDAEKDVARLSRGREDQARWEVAARLLPKNRVKLLLNMLLIAGQTIPRGGKLTVDRSAAANNGFQGDRGRNQCPKACSRWSPPARRPSRMGASMPRRPALLYWAACRACGL